MYNSQHWNREYDYSQKQNHSLDTYSFESDDGKYFTSFSMVDFGSGGATSRYMWCVDCNTPKTLSSDEDLFSNYYDPFGFTKAINFKKLDDPKVLKELEKIFLKEEKRSDLRKAHDLKGSKKLW